MLELDGRRIEAQLPSRQLFGYLALNRDRAITRDELVDALWPYATPAAAPSALTVLVSKVRAALGAHVLCGRSELWLELPPGARRPLLPEHDTPWLDEWRHRLDDVQDRALEAYAASCLGIGGTELPGAERAARTLLERSPLRETGYALLMDALAAQGNLGEAMRIYDRARTTLDHELGITPGPAVQEAHGRLLGLPSTRRPDRPPHPAQT